MPIHMRQIIVAIAGLLGCVYLTAIKGGRVWGGADPWIVLALSLGIGARGLWLWRRSRC